MLDICLLGTGGMMPLPGRWLSSMLLRHEGSLALVDCGEGTQIPMKQAGWGFKAVDNIFFTHCHADHVAGLPGLLLTVGNAGKETPLDIYGPPGIRRVAESLLVLCPDLPYDIRVAELPMAGGIADEGAGKGFALFGCLSYSYLPANHGMPCVSYRFSVRRRGEFFPERARALGIPLRHWRALQLGGRATLDDGRTVEPGAVVGPERKGVSVCYCTDSRPTARMPGFFSGADLLVCEGLYGDDAPQGNAAGKLHMVFGEAARLASDAGVGELWLTHYSPAMPNPQDYIGVATSRFPNSRCGRDLMSTTLTFK